MAASNTVTAKVIWDPDEVEARLNAFGLTSEIFSRAVAVGDQEASNCTENDPVTLSGSVRWGRSTRSLRDDLLPQGWTRSTSDGIETVVHPDRSLAIAVARGDERTGVAGDESPKTKYSRGRAVQSRVLWNAQYSLFEMPPQVVRAPRGLPTYFLLQYPTNQHVAYEVSLPEACDETGRFSAYAERLVFAPYRRDGDPTRKIVEPPLNIDVPVTRRA